MLKIKNKTDFAIFTALQSINPDMKLFILINGEDLDLIFNSMFSERVLIYPDKSNEQSAKFINALYSKKWDNVYNLLTAGENTIDDLGVTHSETRTEKEIVNDIDTLSAFNSESFENDTQTDRTRNIEETTIKADKNIRNFKVSFEYLQNNFIRDTVFKDTIDLLTYHII